METKFKYTHNVYIAIWEEGSILNYRVIVNADEETKNKLYADEKEGKFRLTKILSNEH